ncbi:hypothetical protein E1B28_007848 [Marasmius oreades]|uniref:Uncharacterized protein n=1 Tax=Marasmius oreades TaxID=181124 RepID=A0A9P7S4A2_9AGAR|nr:uncharacterized protein E1B28_007848 [Marasmius oreades]KAG7094243.1 hypothetical protein E1B28_007848 [Marasmius oreades]
MDIHDVTDDIRVYHTSFTDYLCTESRSAKFYINEPRQREFLSCRWLTALCEHCKPQAKSFHYRTVKTLFKKWGKFFSSVKQPSEQLLYELGSLDILSLLIATGANLVVDDSYREPSERWRLLFRSFQTIASWLNREGVHPRIIEHFVDVQDRIQVNPSLDEETRRDLESWVIFNVTRCRWRCPLTERVDTSVAKLFASVRKSKSSSGPLSLAGPTSTPGGVCINIQDGCFRTVKRLHYDLKTSIARHQKLEFTEIGSTLHNLLISTLLESCVPQPELLSILRTISDVVKMYSKITRGRLHIFGEARNKLLSLCEFFPDAHGYAECTDLVINQILPFCIFYV